MRGVSLSEYLEVPLQPGYPHRERLSAYENRVNSERIQSPALPLVDAGELHAGCSPQGVETSPPFEGRFVKPESDTGAGEIVEGAMVAAAALGLASSPQGGRSCSMR